MSIQNKKKIFKNISQKDFSGKYTALFVHEVPHYEEKVRALRKEFNGFTKSISPQDLYVPNIGEYWQVGTKEGRVYKTYFSNQFKHKKYHVDGLSLLIKVDAKNISIVIRTTSKLKDDHRKIVERYILSSFSTKEYNGFETRFVSGAVIYDYTGSDETKDVPKFKSVLLDICKSYIKIIHGILESEEFQIMKENKDISEKPLIATVNKYLQYVYKTKKSYYERSPENSAEKETKKAMIAQVKEESYQQKVSKKKTKKKKKSKSKNPHTLCENKIFYGVSGSGVTHKLQEIKEHYDGFVTVSFHQNYRYEDFVEELKTKTSIEGDTSYEIVDGIFKDISYQAKTNPDKNYAIFIHELNRANVSKVFGELLSIFDISKRKGYKDEMGVTLQYSKEVFYIPSNLSIIGGLSLENKETSALDLAFRRAFILEELLPNYELLAENIEGVNLQKILKILNRRIEYLLGKKYMVGHAYFLECSSFSMLQNIFKTKVIPLLVKYFNDDLIKVDLVLNRNGFIESEYINLNELFSNCSNIDMLEQKNIHKVSDYALQIKENYIKIYEKSNNRDR